MKYTDYIGELVYEGDNLQFIQHAEGRVLPDGANWEYQYHLKDHLGNVRVTFTTKPQSPVNYSANLEDGNPNSGEGVFGNYTSTVFDLVDHTDPGTSQQRVQWLNGGASGRVGLTKSLSVMPGDRVSVTAYAKYMNLTGNGNPNAFATALTAAFGVSSGSTGEQFNLYNSLNAYGVSMAGGEHPNDDDAAPKAFVTILLFDRDYNLLDAAWDQITTDLEQVSATEKEPFDYPLSKEVTVQEAGYAYIFLSNEHPTYVDVYFDDVTVSHTLSPIISSADYYPFGLAFNSYARENSTPQDYKYNSKEEQTELGLGWLDYGARMYQPELGRFFTQDRFADKYLDSSPYSYGLNNPVLYVDINGDSVWTTTQSRTDADGNVTVTNTINITGKVLKQSSGRTTAQGVATGLNARLNSQKNTGDPVKNKDGTTTTTVTKINANFTAAGSMNDVSSSDHLVVIVDNVTGQADPNLGGGEAGGQAVLGGQIAYVENAGAVETAFHEVGHNLGMTHPDSNNGNPMSYNGQGANFSGLQLMQAYNKLVTVHLIKAATLELWEHIFQVYHMGSFSVPQLHKADLSW